VFAVLGEIIFELVGSPESLESVRNYHYAEHRVIEERPRLQWLSSGLETIRLELTLHSSFTNPALELLALRSAADAHQALPLVFGNGEYRGYFVIESIAVRSVQLSGTGDPVAVGVGLEIREWVADGAGELDRLLQILTPAIAVVQAAGGPDAPAGSASGGRARRAARPAGGISALLSNPNAPVARPEQLRPDDVAPEQIVRSAVRQ